MRRQMELIRRQNESMRRQMSQRGLDEATKTDSSIVYKLTDFWHLPLFQSSQT